MSNIPGAFARSTCGCADSECEHRQETIPELPPKREDRVKGQIYINKKEKKGTWDGYRLLCQHSKQKSKWSFKLLKNFKFGCQDQKF